MKYVIGLIILAVIATGAVVLATRDDNSQGNTNNSSNQTTTPPPQSSNTTTSGSQQPATDKVSISNFAFSPANITVKKGTTVTWTNNDSTAHTIDFEKDSLKDSQNLSNGDTYSFTFNDEGTFKYICGLHPSMSGSVTVAE